MADARAAVDSYLGVTVSIDGGELPFTLVAMEGTPEVTDGVVSSSVRIPLPAGHAGRGAPSATVILYASQPGAFVDLAADLTWLTGVDADDFCLDQHLNQHVRPADQGAPTAVHLASMVNQAVGVLIGQGHPPELAVRELDQRAAVAGTDRYLAAVDLLGAL